MNKYKFIIKESAKYILRSSIFIKKNIRNINYLESLSENEYNEYVNQTFLNIFNKAFNHSPFYNKLYTKHGINAGTIKTIEDINKLPVICREDIQSCSKELLTRKNKSGIHNGYTSGSTGTPLHVMYSLKSLRNYYAYIIHHRNKLGFKNGDKLASIRGRLHSGKLCIYTSVSNTLHLSSYMLNEANSFKYHELLTKFSPKAIEGYPSSLYNLSVLLKTNNLSLNIPICFTSSETLFDYQKELIQEVFGTKINDLYGNAERIINLSQIPGSNLYYAPRGYSYNEFTETGQPLCTTLINYAFPLIRYKVNDIIIPISENEKDIEYKQYEKPVAEKIEGRIEDVIIANNKERIGRLDFLFKKIQGMLYAQIIQNKSGQIIINIVPSSSYSEKTNIEIINNIDKYIGLSNIDYEINLITTNEIIYSKANKFRLVVSNI